MWKIVEFYMYILSLLKLKSDKKYQSVHMADPSLQIGTSDNSLSYFSRFLVTLNTGKC